MGKQLNIVSGMAQSLLLYQENSCGESLAACGAGLTEETQQNPRP